MFCDTCGMANPDDRSRCEVCDASLPKTPPREANPVYIDFTQYPFSWMFRVVRKGTPAITAVLFLPILSVVYWIKRLAGNRFLVPIMAHDAPRLHPTRLGDLKRLRKREFDAHANWLTEQGFAPLMDLEDASLPQGIIRNVWIHPERRIYAANLINKAMGRVMYTAFHAFLSSRAYLSADNGEGPIPIQCPPNIRMVHHPGADLPTLMDRFTELLSAMDGEPMRVSRKGMLSSEYRIRRLAVSLGEKQGYFHRKTAKAPSVTTCYHHPHSVAVRRCGRCGISLCEACYIEDVEGYRCNECHGLGPAAPAPAPGLPDPSLGYAGLGVRLSALLLDVALIGVLAAGLYFALSRGIAGITADPVYAGTPLLGTQFFVAAFTVLYFTVPLKRYGRTLGMGAWGLRVVDPWGERPDTVSVILRLAYHLLSAVFLFPMAGYLVIPFRKRKQGFHDQLSETFVVGRRVRTKALLGWPLVAGLTGLAVWKGAALIPFWLLPWNTPDFTPEVALAPAWEMRFGEEPAVIFSTDLQAGRWIVTTYDGITALDPATGEILWSSRDITGGFIHPDLAMEPNEVPIRGSGEGEGELLAWLDPRTGEVIRRLPVAMAEPLILSDGETLLFYEGLHIRAHGPDLRLRWARTLSGEETIDTIDLNGGVLAQLHGEAYGPIYFLDAATGETVWEEKESGRSPGYALGGGHQFFYSAAGETSLVHLPDRTTLWTIPADAGYVVAHDGTAPVDGGQPPERIYSTTAVLEGSTGRTVAAYPDGLRFGCLADDRLVLIPVMDHRAAATVDRALVLVDRTDGRVLRTVSGPRYLHVRVLHEDTDDLFLVAVHRSATHGKKAVENRASLIRLSKSGLDPTVTFLGVNLTTNAIRLLPDPELLLIPTRRQVGAYRLLPNDADPS